MEIKHEFLDVKLFVLNESLKGGGMLSDDGDMLYNIRRLLEASEEALEKPSYVYHVDEAGTETWRTNGALDRQGLPAVIRKDGSCEYWEKGRRIMHSVPRRRVEAKC